ncbi:MAG: hypothetical protein ACYCVN_12520 [Acidimicrobiales bacterium]
MDQQGQPIWVSALDLLEPAASRPTAVVFPSIFPAGDVSNNFAGAIYLLGAGIIIIIIVSIALTMDLFGMMSKAELRAQHFTERMPWARPGEVPVAKRLTRIRTVILIPLYLIGLLWLFSAVVEFTR